MAGSVAIVYRVFTKGFAQIYKDDVMTGSCVSCVVTHFFVDYRQRHKRVLSYIVSQG